VITALLVALCAVEKGRGRQHGLGPEGELIDRAAVACRAVCRSDASFSELQVGSTASPRNRPDEC